MKYFILAICFPPFVSIFVSVKLSGMVFVVFLMLMLIKAKFKVYEN